MSGETLRYWMATNRGLQVLWQRNQEHGCYHAVRQFYAPSRVEEAELAGATKHSAYLVDRELPDRGTPTAVVAAEVARKAEDRVRVDDVVELLLAQHLRCGACGVALQLRRFSDYDPCRFALARIRLTDGWALDNVVALCLACDVLDSGHIAVVAEVGADWRTFGRNAMIEAPRRQADEQPDAFDELVDEARLLNEKCDFDALVMAREPASHEAYFDDVRL